MPYVYDIDVDTIFCLFACADVAPRRSEVELQRASAHQEPERLLRGERDVNVRMPWCDLLSQRGKRGDVGLMTLVLGHHTLLRRLPGVDFEDIRRRLEAVLQDVPEGIWSRIQDEGILEQCVGVPPPWRAIVQ
jgi:hypothetical protein